LHSPLVRLELRSTGTWQGCATLMHFLRQTPRSLVLRSARYRGGSSFFLISSSSSRISRLQSRGAGKSTFQYMLPIIPLFLSFRSFLAVLAFPLPVKFLSHVDTRPRAWNLARPRGKVKISRPVRKENSFRFFFFFPTGISFYLAHLQHAFITSLQ